MTEMQDNIKKTQMFLSTERVVCSVARKVLFN